MLSEEEIKQITEKVESSQDFRMGLALKSFAWFFIIYFGHYIKYPMSDYHWEWCNILQDAENYFAEIMGFRGSTKTVYSVLALPIYEMIASKSNYTVLLGETFPQAKEHIYNIKTELDNNKKLIKDFGPFDIVEETSRKEEWQKTSLIIPRYNAKITAKSMGQKIRGSRFKQYRPQLVIADDIESLESVVSKEQRDKTYKWFNGEVIPAGDESTKYILIGNLLSSDGLMSRIKREILDGRRRGVVREYPFFKEDGTPLWKEKFSTPELVLKEKMKVDDRTWNREYLLKIVPEEGQVVKEEWLTFYDSIPIPQITRKATGVDLAISKTKVADSTAMVSGKMGKVNGTPKIYVLPNPINEKLTGFETTDKAKSVSLGVGDGSLTKLFVEDVAYQKMQIEAMVKAGLPAEGVKVSTDKRARLQTIAGYIQNGTVMFPRAGCEDLITQLLGFGTEPHDDLVDAFVFLVQGLMNQYSSWSGMEVWGN